MRYACTSYKSLIICNRFWIFFMLFICWRIQICRTIHILDFELLSFIAIVLYLLTFSCVSECILSWFSRVLLFATPWTVAHQALWPCDSPGQNTWSGRPTLLQRSSWLRDGTRVSLFALAKSSWPLAPPGKPFCLCAEIYFFLIDFCILKMYQTLIKSSNLVIHYLGFPVR